LGFLIYPSILGQVDNLNTFGHPVMLSAYVTHIVH